MPASQSKAFSEIVVAARVANFLLHPNGDETITLHAPISAGQKQSLAVNSPVELVIRSLAGAIVQAADKSTAPALPVAFIGANGTPEAPVAPSAPKLAPPKKPRSKPKAKKK